MDLAGLGILPLILISCIFIFSLWNMISTKQKLPPGPIPLPLIGNLLQIMRGEMVASLMKMWEQYGSIFTLYFGPKPVIVLCGYQTVKEALVDHAEEFGARGNLPVMDMCIQGYGLGFANGEIWKQMRTFTLKTLKNFGMGKKSIEEKIQEETQFMLDEMRKLKEKPIDPTMILMKAVSNILCSILFGNRFEYNEKPFNKLLNILEETLHHLSNTLGQLYNILPKLMNCIPGPHKKIFSLTDELLAVIEENVKVHQDTLDQNAPRDFIDCFLIKMQQEKQNPNTEFNMKNLLATAHSLFIGGTETISTTLRHGLLILLTYPEIQAKLHDEIDRVIGQNRLPNMDDKINMPYMAAVIHEIQRFADITPMSVPHSVTKDTHFKGYYLCKGTTIYTLLCTVLRDPSQFSTPYKFNPNHFLDENGMFKKNEASMVFSAGKRSCLGESLARMELFLFLTSILQNFTLTSKIQYTESDVTPKMTGIFKFPINYQLSFVPR
ncbi:cytochrome P450 2G1-like [Bombina bombina]|uniref:cytochrome P450 2G1-like n=1 Tax=Bombina bombina TaxID=8345 RepID=UPI00235B0DBD|nr:cytochrome P450 2G1-like [Bombina bombina]